VVIGLAGGAVIKSQDAGVNWKLLHAYKRSVNRVTWQSGSLYVVVRNSGLYKGSGQGMILRTSVPI